MPAKVSNKLQHALPRSAAQARQKAEVLIFPQPTKPFLKWVGGKRSLLPIIKSLMPKDFNRFYEPFVGGGALFFSLAKKDSVINDYNEELINAYKAVKNRVNLVIENLKTHKNTEKHFYKVRETDRAAGFQNTHAVERASRFIYLNKTAYNGLYRVNASGYFNTPFGRYKNPTICDEVTLRSCSATLRTCTIMTGDFETCVADAKAGDFVYFDPPYVPLNQTSSFTSYTDQGFNEGMQQRLKDLCDKLTERGVYFMLSNSYTEYTLALYDEYYIHHVEVGRAINCKAKGRGKVKEIIVTNYKN